MFLGLENHNSDNTSYIYNEETDPEMSAAEKEYYDKILELLVIFKKNMELQLINIICMVRFLIDILRHHLMI